MPVHHGPSRAPEGRENLTYNSCHEWPEIRPTVNSEDNKETLRTLASPITGPNRRLGRGGALQLARP